MKYVAYADESRAAGSRHRSICLFSFPASQHSYILSALATILRTSNISEFTWDDLDNDKHRFCALELLEFALGTSRACDWRVDVMAWDNEDVRPVVPGEDDGKDLERIFFHLLKSAMNCRTPGASWRVFPDEKLEVDWQVIQDCVRNPSLWSKYVEQSLFDPALLQKSFRLDEFRAVRSHEEPACQVANLFAGLAAFSREMVVPFALWRSNATDQDGLCHESAVADISDADRERFHVLEEFGRRCRSMRLGVSLRSGSYLITRNPEHPINFWHYRPEHAAEMTSTHRS